MANETLYRLAMDAQGAWEAELTRAYGKQAHEARYDARGRETPKLAALAKAKDATYHAFRIAAFPHAREAV